MLKRKAYLSLKKWRSSKNKECLLIKGARQVGKTFLVQQFGKREYQSFIELNFIKDPAYMDIFDGSLDAKEIYKKMSIYLPGKKFIPGNTLIFLDEIQKCSKARTALKFLAEDNSYDVVVSGSLLGLSYGTDADKEVEEVESIPVGYEKQMMLYSLDFEEFLWARGYSEDNIKYLKSFYDNKLTVPKDINEKFEQLFKEYIVVGGMPEVVDEYIKTNNFNAVKEVQEKILSNYDNDITNHAKKTEKPKIRRCYNSLPNQLAKENKRYMYSEVEKGSGSKKYGDSITWLIDSNLVHTCYNVVLPEIPLVGNRNENEFKLYINDTGLLMAKYGDNAKLSLLNNTIKGNVKGGIYENVISESLLKKGYSLHYYKTSNSSQEIEFIIEQNGEVIPIEVKAGNKEAISLNNYINKYKPSIAYKLINGNLGIVDRKYTIPHYMILFI